MGSKLVGVQSFVEIRRGQGQTVAVLTWNDPFANPSRMYRGMYAHPHGTEDSPLRSQAKLRFDRGEREPGPSWPAGAGGLTMGLRSSRVYHFPCVIIGTVYRIDDVVLYRMAAFK